MSNILFIMRIVAVGWAFNLLIGGPLTNFLKEKYLVDYFGYSLFVSNIILYTFAFILLVLFFPPISAIFRRFLGK